MQKHTTTRNRQKTTQPDSYHLAYYCGKLAHKVVKKLSAWLSAPSPVLVSPSYPKNLDIPAIVRKKNISLNAWYRKNVQSTEQCNKS